MIKQKIIMLEKIKETVIYCQICSQAIDIDEIANKKNRLTTQKGEPMPEKKLSEELRHCLDNKGCGKCPCFEQKSVLTCRGLLQAAYEQIKQYEELEKQGKLRIFPCCVGDTVYRINKGAEQPIIPLQVMNFKVFNNNLVQSFKMECVDEWDGAYTYRKMDIGHEVFLTIEQAEAELKKNEEVERKIKMDRLTVCETDRGRYSVRPMSWAGIWNEKGQIKESLNHLALFIEKEDAEKFVEWKKLEEQGKLIKLPCKVGDTVYTACSWGIESGIVGSIEIMQGRIFVNNQYGEMIGQAENIFLTQPEAE